MSARLIRAEAPKARKNHRCIWCGQSILKGFEYLLVIVEWEGGLETQKWHEECYGCAAADCDEEFLPYSNERPA